MLAERWRVHYGTINLHSQLELQITGTRGMADKQHGAWRSGETAMRYTSHRRRLRRSVAALH